MKRTTKYIHVELFEGTPIDIIRNMAGIQEEYKGLNPYLDVELIDEGYMTEHLVARIAITHDRKEEVCPNKSTPSESKPQP